MKSALARCGATRVSRRSRIRNSRRGVAVRIDDYDDITLIWLLCIIRDIELAKDSPRREKRRGTGSSGGSSSRGVCVTGSGTAVYSRGEEIVKEEDGGGWLGAGGRAR